ncbi:N-6 DNA methylase [Streptomyces sp. NPDC056749]|uniref:N-6 DNA methylase n=1 Tax=Streptomyces sp. NPDC056749 TaxID=3345936 RepID=UPI00368D3F11
MPHDHYLLLLMALVHLRRRRPETWRDGEHEQEHLADTVRYVLQEEGLRHLSELLARALDGCSPRMLTEIAVALGAGSPEAPCTTGAEAGAEAFDLLLAAYGETASGTAGELPTPPAVARAVTGMLMGEPPASDSPSLRLHDPYCRAGEMLAASVDVAQAFAGASAALSVSGTGGDALHCELARMNVGQRGLSADLRHEPAPGPGAYGSGPGAGFDRVVTNPPFNVRTPGAARRFAPYWRYGDPPAHNANYDWLQYVVGSLSAQGRASVVMPTNAASSAHSGEQRIRRAMIEDGAVEGLVALPPHLFAATSVAVTVWLLKHPTGSCQDVFFVDATRLGSMVSRTRRVLSAEDTDLLVEVTRSRTEREGFSRTVGIDEIRTNGHSLSATAYLTTRATGGARTVTEGQIRELTGRLSDLGDLARRTDRHIEDLFKEYGL